MPRTKKDPTPEVKDNKATSKKAESTLKQVTPVASKQTAATKAYPKVKQPEPKPNTITRLELSQEVAKAVGRMMEITGRDAEAIISEILSSMVDALKSGDEIEIRGFGSFRLRTRNARRGRNPKTGESVDVPSKTVVYFKMGADLKEFLKQK